MDSQATNQYIRQVLHHTESPPSIETRYFYTSPIPIDDPLSPLPPPTNNFNAPSRLPPKPFSKYDNVALEKAWHDLRLKTLKYNEEHAEEKKAVSHETSRTREAKESKKQSGTKPSTPRSLPTRHAASSLSHVDGPPTGLSTSLDMLDGPSLAAEVTQQPDTTGTPFIRAPSRTKVNTQTPARQGRDDHNARPTMHPQDTYRWEDASHLAEHSPVPEQGRQESGPTAKTAVGVSRLHQVEFPDMKMTPIYWTPVHDEAQVVRGTWFYQDTMLPVETPVANMLEAGYIELQVWTDTWKDELASAVEVGAVGEMKIVHKLWPERAPKQPDSRPASRDAGRAPVAAREDLLRTAATNLVELEPETPDLLRERAVETACDIIDIATGSEAPDNKASGSTLWGRQGTTRTYAHCGVIYSNEREARILKPSLMPSAYYGRRPLANYIRKDYKIGVPVVRGFDQNVWDKLYPTKDSAKARKADEGVSSSASGVSPEARQQNDPELAKAERPTVTDLIFVIHGIGQKLSQRMESFHFTHAINAFRREVNVEVGSKDCKSRFRKEMGGIMVLPINWRHSLSFEEGGYRDVDEDPAHNAFDLLDITPDTLPQIRNIVSDVMLDIPYYMSHHQPKMIAAVIQEANRVYRLWCLNNPGFHTNGRVHIIAHSLGSVMAVDILSKQPTRVPQHLADPTSIAPERASDLDFFLFNTHNVFLAGSPAGFFLLLRKARLMPRIDSASAASEEDPGSLNASICGTRGTYGCIAVENIYNIINGYDPVAYRMNATVDAAYAASLKKAHIPSASSGWFGSSRTSLFSGTGGTSGKSLNTPPAMPRLPSNVELETHNFSREEIAEKRMLQLNDNAQIDFFLRYGGGTFEIQYLTMLGAHSSYWGLKDFVRMIVVEVGRPKGRQGTVEGMRAVKAKAQLGG